MPASPPYPGVMHPPRKPASDARAILRAVFCLAVVSLLAVPGSPPGVVAHPLERNPDGTFWYATNLASGYETCFWAHPDFTPRRADVMLWEGEPSFESGPVQEDLLSPLDSGR